MTQRRPETERPEVLLGFGNARLVRRCDGEIELQGGSENDQKKALEWAEHYLPPRMLPRIITPRAA